MKIQSSHSSCILSNDAVNVTHNVNLSFEIGTSHIHASGSKSLQDDNVLSKKFACAHLDDENGKLQDKSHGNHQNGHSDFSTNCMNYLSNPHGMRQDNECFSGKQESQSNNNSPGFEAIGQYVKMNGKSKGKSHSIQRPIIEDTRDMCDWLL